MGTLEQQRKWIRFKATLKVVLTFIFYPLIILSEIVYRWLNNDDG